MVHSELLAQIPLDPGYLLLDLPQRNEHERGVSWAVALDRHRIELPEGPYETVAGHVVAVLGHVPDVGETVDVPGHRLAIIEMDGRRVKSVRFLKGGGTPAARTA